MSNLLRKLKLIDNHDFELEISREEFVTKLGNNIVKSDLGMFSDIFEVFSSNDKDYKGNVSYDSFEIKKRKRMFERNMNFATINGKFYQTGKNLTIETEINGFPKIFIFFFIIIALIYILFLGFFIGIGAMGEEDAPPMFVVFPFIIIHGLLMLGIPIFIMRRNVKKTKKNIEKDFFYIANKK